MGTVDPVDAQSERERLADVANADARAAHAEPRRPLLVPALVVLALLSVVLVVAHLF